jgi:hypothetical protein
VPEAQVQPESLEGAQPSGEPVDLEVAVERRLADAAGAPARGIQPLREVGDRLLEALGDRCEVLLVRRDERRIGFCGQAIGQVEDTSDEGVHGLRSGLGSLRRAGSRVHGRPVCATTGALRQGPLPPVS